MGSEHYCLRWNNHQSNLLGVFSQLLHDESLVDVTLACAEGPSIRAHKVVLSACSSYFQSLFLEHPATHPIVILKDVRFSELKNLVDFMYKGEVNIQYCQLPTLLKTAESLKVKGLAEMTNQNSTQRETEHEQDRIRPVPTPKSSDHLDYQSTLKHEYDDPDRCLSSSPVHMQSSSPTPLALYKRRSPRDTNETASIHGSSSKKIHLSSNIITNDDQQDPSNENPNDREINPESSEALNSMGLSGGHQSCLPPPSPMSTVDLKSMQGCTILTTTATFTSAGASTTTVAGSSMSSNAIVPSDNRLSSPMLTPEPVAGPSGLGPVQSVPLSLKKEIDWDRSDDKSISECSNDYRHQHDSDVTESQSSAVGVGNMGGGVGLSTRSGNEPQTNPVHQCIYCHAAFPNQSKLTRHILSHSLESLKHRDSTTLMLMGLNPDIQQHYRHRTVLPNIDPIDQSDSGGNPIEMGYAAAAAAAAVATSANSTATSTVSSEQGNLVLCKFCGKSFPDVPSLIGHLPIHTGDRPFKCEFCGKAFKLRHHMKDHCRVHTGERPFRCQICGKTFSRSTILKAHEKTHYPKYYNMRLPPSKMLGRHTMFNRTNPYAPCHSMNRLSPYPYGLSLFDADPSKLLTVFQQQSLLAEEAFRMRGILFPTSEAIRYNILDLINKESESKSQAIQQRSSSTIISSEKYTSSDHGSSASSSVSKQRNPNIQNSPTSSSSPQCSKDNAKTETTSTDGRTNLTHESTDTSSSNRSSFVDELLMLHKRNTEGIRDNLASFACDSELGGPDQCSTPSGSSSSPSLSTKSLSESMLFQEPIEEETKCVVCNANFPSVWLLEQHASLQHAGVNDEKPFICEQCGQSYRYRSAYAKHREQNHRARLPADKLFTCDVCGMQFRYLKSFKKHRLNHALERIHGKVEKKYQTKVIDSSNNDVVTSSNEMLSNRLDNNIGGDESKDTTTTTGAQEGDEDQDATIDSASTTMKTDQLIDGEQERANDEMQVNLLAISSQSSEVNRFEQPDAINYSHFLQQNQRTSPLPTTSLSALISAKAMTSDQILGLNPQEASLLNFFRVDAAERQRERTKQNNNRFACPFCGKCVRSKENLKLHVRKHTGERPFVCLFCGRAFGGKSDLTRHLRIHTGERPYHCESCGKCFARADYLSKHLTTHVHNSPR